MNSHGPGSDLYRMIVKTAELFTRLHRKPCAYLTTCPGRINILGEHTDYLEGLSLPAAVDCWTVVAFAPQGGGVITVRSENYDGEWQGRLVPGNDRVQSGWQRYIEGIFQCFRELVHEKGLSWHGAHLMVSSNIPPGRGLSSSASLELSVVHALNIILKTQIPAEECVRISRRVENTFLGVPGGFLDQMACQYSEAGKIALIDFQSLSFTKKEISGLRDWKWICIDSGVRRELSEGGFGKRVAECRNALEIIKTHRSDVRGYRDVAESDLHFLEMTPVLRNRIRHMLTENLRVLEGVRALTQGNFDQLGALMNSSHKSLRDLYQVSCRELDEIQNFVINLKGCAGARMMGGGFGGCVLALVHRDSVSEFLLQTENFRRLPGKERVCPFVLSLTDGVSAFRVISATQSVDHLSSQGPVISELYPSGL